MLIDFTVNGECSNCGECCSGVLPLSQNEIERIKRYLTQNPVKEQWHNGRMGIDMTCPFRDERERVCLIYPVRPDICAAFMCNNTPEDIERSKINFHVGRAVTYMRDEFFGANTQEAWAKEVIAWMTEFVANGGARND